MAKRPNRKPAAEKPIVRHGDVAAVLHNELVVMFQAHRELTALRAAIAKYKAHDPDRHAHLVAFLAGQPASE